MRADGQENQPLIEGWSFHSRSLILGWGEGLEVRLITHGQWIMPVSWRLHKTQLDKTGRASRLVNTEHPSRALSHTSLLCAVPQLSLYCSVAQSGPTPCDAMNCSILSFPVLHYLPEFARTHVCWVGDAIQPSHPLFPPSSLALSLSQHQGLFQWVDSSHQVVKILEPQLQLQHQPFQWIFRTDFL